MGGYEGGVYSQSLLNRLKSILLEDIVSFQKSKPLIVIDRIKDIHPSRSQVSKEGHENERNARTLTDLRRG